MEALLFPGLRRPGKRIASMGGKNFNFIKVISYLIFDTKYNSAHFGHLGYI